MCTDIEGNHINVGDIVYICDAAIYGSKSRRLLRCEVTSVSGVKCTVYCHENDQVYNKTTRCTLRPLMS